MPLNTTTRVYLTAIDADDDLVLCSQAKGAELRNFIDGIDVIDCYVDRISVNVNKVNASYKPYNEHELFPNFT